jgi:hypothetical protein
MEEKTTQLTQYTTLVHLGENSQSEIKTMVEQWTNTNQQPGKIIDSTHAVCSNLLVFNS